MNKNNGDSYVLVFGLVILVTLLLINKSEDYGRKSYMATCNVN